MEKKAILRNMARDCIPTVFALCLTGMYSVVDGLFIGRAVGDEGLAAVNLAWPVPAVITALGIGIGIGGSVLYSRHLGRKEEEEASAVFYVTITSLLVFGILTGMILCVIGRPLLQILGAGGVVYSHAWKYVQVISAGAVFQVLGAGLIPILRNRHRAYEAMVAMSAGMLTNIILNYILMFQVKIGVQGAAIGTVAAQFVVVGIAISCLYRKENVELHLHLNGKTLLDIVKTGVPGFGLSIAPSVVLIFTNYRCAGFGGDTAVACYAVISYMEIEIFGNELEEGITPVIWIVQNEKRIKLTTEKTKKGYRAVGEVHFLKGKWNWARLEARTADGEFLLYSNPVWQGAKRNRFRTYREALEAFHAN